MRAWPTGAVAGGFGLAFSVVADATIADVQVRTPTLIYLTGKKAGSTTLYAVDGRNDIKPLFSVTTNDVWLYRKPAGQ